MEKKIIGSVVAMAVVAIQRCEVGVVVTPDGEKSSLYGVKTGYAVEIVDEGGSKGIRVTVVREGAPYTAELSDDGVVTILEGSAEGFVEVCKDFIPIL